MAVLDDYLTPQQRHVEQLSLVGSTPPPPVQLPPYYLAAPGSPSAPPPVAPQVVDRQAYWQEQRQMQEEQQRQQAIQQQREAAQQQIDAQLATARRAMAPVTQVFDKADYFDRQSKVNIADYGYDPGNPQTWAAAQAQAKAEARRRADAGITDVQVRYPGQNETPMQGVANVASQFGRAGKAVMDVATTQLPGMDRVANVAEQVGETVGQHAIGALTLPGVEYLPGVSKVSDVAGTVMGKTLESLVPTEVWQAALTLLPAAKARSIPELLSAITIGDKDALTAIKQAGAGSELRVMAKNAGMSFEEFIASKQGDDALRALLAKRGLKPIGGGAVDEAGNLPEPKPIVPATTSEGVQSIAAKMRSMIASARKLGPEQARMISEQKSARVAGAAQRLEQGGGLPAFHESKSFLAGEYDKPTFEPLNIPAEDVNALVDHIGTMAPAPGENPQMFYWRKVNALTAIEKPTLGVKPAEHELKALESFLPNSQIRAAFEQQAMAGDVRGLGGAKQVFPSDRSGTQLDLTPPGTHEANMARSAEIQAQISERQAAERAALIAQQERDHASYLKFHEENLPSRGATQSRLPDPEIEAQWKADNAETLRRMDERHAAELDRLAKQRESDAASAQAMRDANLPSAGMQTRLAEAVNESYVGAIAAGDPAKNGPGRILRLLHLAASPLSFVKTLKTSFDVGWGGRQGWRLMPRNPREWWSMYGKQFKALKSEKNFAEMEAATKAFPNFERSQSMERPLAYLQRGTGSSETSGEEFLLEAGQNRVVDAARWLFNPSERAYVAPGNWMRQAVLDKQVRKLVRINKVPVSDADFQFLIDNLNNATLRGNTKWLGKVNAETLGSLLFSLKGQVSGPQFMGDFLRAAMNTGDFTPAARQIVAQQVGAYIGMGMTTLGLAAATGYGLNKAGKTSWVGVDLNKDSKTFGEINVGGFRWNYWGADAPLVRYALAAYQGHRQEAAGLPSTDVSRWRLAKNFAGSKVAPGVPRALWVQLVNDGYDPYAQRSIRTKHGALLFALDQVDPMFFSNSLDAYNDLGPAAVVPAYLANVSGMSTATYDTSPTAEQAKTGAKTAAQKSLKQAGVPFSGNEIDFTRPILAAKPDGERTKRQLIADTLKIKVADDASLAEMRDAYVSDDRVKRYMDANSVSEPVARSRVSDVFDAFPPVADAITRAKSSMMNWWAAHPDKLKDAIDSGQTPESDEKNDILRAAGLLK